jgi:hypothetical protein
VTVTQVRGSWHRGAAVDVVGPGVIEGLTLRTEGAMRMMKRAICVALSLLGAMVAWPSAVMAQATVSAGCQALNDPALDATYRLREVGPLEFFAGETIAVVAGTSPDPADDVRFQVLSETGAIIETQGGPVPAAFSFTVPTDRI